MIAFASYNIDKLLRRIFAPTYLLIPAIIYLDYSLQNDHFYSCFKMLEYKGAGILVHIYI